MGPDAAVLEDARVSSGLSQDQLWMRYFALGGSASPSELDDAMHGDVFDVFQLEILIHALNERFMELNRNHPVPYPDQT